VYKIKLLKSQAYGRRPCRNSAPVFSPPSRPRPAPVLTAANSESPGLWKSRLWVFGGISGPFGCVELGSGRLGCRPP
jgi:hypothetical protein